MKDLWNNASIRTKKKKKEKPRKPRTDFKIRGRKQKGARHASRRPEDKKDEQTPFQNRRGNSRRLQDMLSIASMTLSINVRPQIESDAKQRKIDEKIWAMILFPQSTYKTRQNRIFAHKCVGREKNLYKKHHNTRQQKSQSKTRNYLKIILRVVVGIVDDDRVRSGKVDALQIEKKNVST